MVRCIGKPALAAMMSLVGFYASAEPVLEEVVVTAQLRAENLQDVPVSVNALTGQKMLDAGITKIEDLQSYVPNMSMSETGIGTNIYIRGIGSGINQGFEQSVGMYVDGVYYGRAQLSRAPFLDLARVEVLRGPQNILYGKNSIAGAISAITAQPGQDFEGIVSLSYEPDFGERVADLVLSGPLTESFGVRLAIRDRTLDGFIDNIDAGDSPERDELTARLVLDWALTDQLDARLKIEQGQFDVSGRQIEVVGDEPSLNPGLGGLNWSQLLYSLGAPSSVLNTRLDGRRSSNGEYSDNDTDNVTLALNYALGDYTLTSITAHLGYEYTELCDCDFTSADLFFVQSSEDFSQFSQEFRITSPAGEKIEWIAGAYYQNSDLDFDDAFFVTPTAVIPDLLDLVLAAPGSPLEGVYPAGAAQQLRGISVPRQFRQSADLWSVFAQVTWSFTDRTRLTLGGRYSDEDKKASRRLTVNGADGLELPYDDLFIPNSYMGIDYLLGALFRTMRHDIKGHQSKDNFAPSVIVEQDLSDDAMAYFSWSKGYKSGGYDVRSNATPSGLLIENPITSAANVQVLPGAFDFDEEQAENFELGMKTTLAEGAAELNVAYFYTEYSDLQVSIYDGVLGFNVGNAAQAVSQGVELDGRWQLTDHLMLQGALAWLDFEFKDYDNGQCTQYQRITSGRTECDFAGKTNQYVAEWTGMLALDYRLPLTGRYELAINLDTIFSSDYNPSQNIDPGIEQGGYYKLNGRIAIAAMEGQWELALIGKNLTDEEIVTYANDTPLAAGLAQSIGYYAFVEPGRSFALQGTYRF